MGRLAGTVDPAPRDPDGCGTGRDRPDGRGLRPVGIARPARGTRRRRAPRRPQLRARPISQPGLQHTNPRYRGSVRKRCELILDIIEALTLPPVRHLTVVLPLSLHGFPPPAPIPPHHAVHPPATL